MVKYGGDLASNDFNHTGDLLKGAKTVEYYITSLPTGEVGLLLPVNSE